MEFWKYGSRELGNYKIMDIWNWGVTELLNYGIIE